MKHALIVAFFGSFRDRFCEYQRPLSIREKLERAARVTGVEGVEIIYPDECPGGGACHQRGGDAES